MLARLSNRSLEEHPGAILISFNFPENARQTTANSCQNEIAAEPRLKRRVSTYLYVEQIVVDELVLPEVQTNREEK